MPRRVQLALPPEVLEDLLRRHQLHAEQLQPLDGASQKALTALVMRTLSGNRRSPSR